MSNSSKVAPFDPMDAANHLPRLLAGDPHDRALLAEVHPADWVNPSPRGRYHLVVIGGGTAGLVTAAIGAALGARVALVERGLMGGDCLNFGCVPSKALIEAARAWNAAGAAAERFAGPSVAGDGDFGRVMDRLREIRARISGHDSAARFRDLGVDVFLGQGEFAGADAVRVGDQELRFRRAVIATGTSPALPPIPGLAESGYRTNETIFALTDRPGRLAIIGAGTIGCELAQAFARLGSRVTMVEAEGRILPPQDPDAADLVARALAEDGIEVLVSAKVTEVRNEGGEKVLRVEVDGARREVRADELLVATGRRPNLEGLALERGGVEADLATGVGVDDRMRTTNPRVYAIGDVASDQKFTHAADAQARLVVRNALFFGRGKASRLVIPSCTYTSPEIAHVGVTAAEVPKRGDEVETLTVAFADVDRARLDGETDGFLRLHLRRGSDTIEGATIVGENVGELLPLVTHAVTHGVGLGSLGDTIFPYPTRGEIIRKAADQWRRRKLTDRTKRLFSAYFRAV